MKHIFWTSLLFGALLEAAPPSIVAGPTIQALGKNFVMIKWRTTDAAGLSSTLAGTLSASAIGATETVAVASGTGGNFPAGAVVKVDREHMRVSSQSGDTLTLSRGYDPEFLRVWEGTLISVSSAANVCTATTPMPHLYTVGDPLRVLRGAINADATYTVATVPNATTFTFACPGTAAGTFNNAGLQLYRFPQAHASGAAITRIDADAQVCYGTSTGYGSSVKSPEDPFTVLRQSVNHFVYVTSLAPGTTYHYKIQSTPRSSGSSSCASPGADTVESADATFVTPANVVGDDLPAAPNVIGKTWTYGTEGLGYATDVTAASNCSDLQAKINAAAAADGALNHRIRIPASANCGINLTLPAKSGSNAGGSGKLVLSTADFADLPAEGTRIDPALYGSHMPTLYTSTSTSVLRVGTNASYWFVRGLKMTANPALYSVGGDVTLMASLNGDDSDYDVTKDPNHIVLQQSWITCPEYNNGCKGVRLHGDYLVVEANDVGPTYGTADQGAVQIDGYDSEFIYIHNNKLQGAMSGYYQSDNGRNPKDVWVERNYITKANSWNQRAWEFQFGATQGVGSANPGAVTTINTTYENAVFTNAPVAFSGATGSWAALNYKQWSVAEGRLRVIVVDGIATATTVTPHGLSSGDRISVGGGFQFPCTGINSLGGSHPITVISGTVFTWATASSNFSTISGTACGGSNLVLSGPVFQATRSDNDTFTIPVNSTGFVGALAAGTKIAYPMGRNIKNTLEFKTGIRAVISGNIIENSWAQNQSGQFTVMSVRGSDMFGGWPLAQGAPEHCWNCAVTIQDVRIQDNLFHNGCVLAAVLGANPNGPVVPLQRVRWAGNLAFGISVANSGGGSCLSGAAGWNGSYNDVSFVHNTVFNAGPWIAEDVTSSFPRSGKVAITDNILAGYANPNNGTCQWAGMAQGKGCAAYSWLDWTATRNVFWGDARAAGSSDPWNFSRQYMSGVTYGTPGDYTANFWPDHVGAVGFAGTRTITSATNTAPIVITTNSPHGCQSGDQVWITQANGNTNANGRWFIRALTATTLELAGSIGNGGFSGSAVLVPFSGTCATPAAATLSNSSFYRSGVTYSAPAGPPSYGSAGRGAASDGANIGTNGATIQAATGSVTFQSIARTNTTAQFTYTVHAGSGETCHVDVSADGFATYTRTADSGTGTARTTMVTGLTASTAYTYRLSCPSVSLAGSFFTNPVAAASNSADGNVNPDGAVAIF